MTMTPEPGQQLASYRLERKLGEGGMGVVWEAVDTRLNRRVAIKFVSESFSQDAEAESRFEREAKLLASVSHPNIATLYGLHEAEGQRFLSMELLDGETLAARLPRGRLEVDEALEIARQIAEGLSAAHRQGLIHRDIKPGNIQITAKGQVKIFDFGLARAVGPDAVTLEERLTGLATASDLPRKRGSVSRTIQYLSPEQARGEKLDARTDIWAFGCILYHLLTGQRPYHARSRSALLHEIETTEIAWSRLPAEVPYTIWELLRHCLARDPRSRLQDIGDARIVLEEALAKGGVPLPPQARSPRRRGGIPAWATAAVAAASMLAGAAAVSMRGPEAPAGRDPLLVDLALPEELRLAGGERRTLAIDPDGSRVVFAAGDARAPGGFEEPRLHQRSLGSFETLPLAGTEGAVEPFFSPGGDEVAFWSRARLRAISLDSHAIREICAAQGGYGGAWLENGSILFTPGARAGLHEVSAKGGTPRALTTPDAARGERSHSGPVPLPGGRAVLFVIEREGRRGHPSIAAVELATGRIVPVLANAASPLFVPPGRLLFQRGRALIAAPFDPGSLELTGPQEPAGLGDLHPDGRLLRADLSRTGTLLFAPTSRSLGLILGLPDLIEQRADRTSRASR